MRDLIQREFDAEGKAQVWRVKKNICFGSYVDPDVGLKTEGWEDPGMFYDDDILCCLDAGEKCYVIGESPDGKELELLCSGENCTGRQASIHTFMTEFEMGIFLEEI